jgi:hypothetical protein
MARTLAALVALVLLLLPGCSKTPPIVSGSDALKLKDGVWATYAWSKNRMAYVIYFVPSTAFPFSPEGVAAQAKLAKEGDLFEGGLDGHARQSKMPFRCDAKKLELNIDTRPYRTSNGSVFLVTVGPPLKVQQLQVVFNPGPKDPEEASSFFQSEVKRILAETPKIKEFPKEPAPDKPKKK